MTGYSALFSPLINYGLGHAHGALSPWKYMYIFAGSITVVWGIILYFILPANPLQAKGLDKRERYIAVARLRTNNNGIRNTHFKMGQVVELLLDPKFWLLFAFALLAMICNGPISTFSLFSLSTPLLCMRLTVISPDHHQGLRFLDAQLSPSIHPCGCLCWNADVDCPIPRSSIPWLARLLDYLVRIHCNIGLFLALVLA